MRGRLLTALALVLPLVGLGASWAQTHHAAQQGTEWEVPIAGYDPRDLLHGHYVIYNYDWPGLPRGDASEGRGTLCFEGQAPVITRTYVSPGEPCEHFVKATSRFNDPEGNLTSGRLYVSQAEGQRLERKLRDPALQGFVRIRVREDGHFTPLRLVFRPRPAEPGAPAPAPPVPMPRQHP